jgi:hypothetical protein
MDGVILDSLEKLSGCLIESVSNFCTSDRVFNEFKTYDLINPGLSRFDKVNYFLELQKEFTNYKREVLFDAILQEFDKLALNARLSSEIDENVFSFIDLNVEDNLFLLSNCDNNQLQTVSAHFGLHRIFGKNLIGTPPSKDLRMAQILSTSNSLEIFSISDSESDAIISRENKIKFAFIERFARDKGGWCLDSELKFANLKELRSIF